MPLALIAVGALLVAVAPTERTLGAGIRWVYVHVGLVWAGTVALGLATLVGSAAVLSGRVAHARWTRACWHAGLLAFALGVVFSMIAARINWGGVFLAEPRMAASLRFLALAAIAGVLESWRPRPRVTGVLAIVTFAVLLWLVGGAELRLHPKDPVRTATSVAIQLTFVASFTIAAALTSWTALAFRARPGAGLEH